jgi:hypothetical protein
MNLAGVIALEMIFDLGYYKAQPEIVRKVGFFALSKALASPTVFQLPTFNTACVA